ncbi:MAG TPA: carbohydrate binding domain-containing protein, partial [Alphaproteobacteria bacterium]|nr:carbohydrate binding domain-containing protein [Alphaproteobacteria bacterium]
MKTPTNLDTPVANLLQYSEQFDNAVWSKTNASVTPNAVISPLGGQTADAVTFSGGAPGNAFLCQQTTPPLAVGRTFTFSCWLKAASGSPTINVMIEDVFTSNIAANAVVTLNQTWQRFSVTATATAGSTGMTPFIYNASDQTNIYHVWGAQLEMGSTATAYAVTTTPAGVQHNDLAKWLQTATEIRMADLYTITLKNPLGSGVNLVPDPNGTTIPWITSLTFSNTGGVNGGGQWSIIGTGAPNGFHAAISQVITVTPGATYTLSGYINASNVTTGGPAWAVENPGLTVGYSFASQQPGANGRVSNTFTVPAGVTQVVVICDEFNSTINNGQAVTFSNPQLELGATATPYANASKLRYTTWDSNLTVLGNTFLTGPPHFQ